MARRAIPMIAFPRVRCRPYDCFPTGSMYVYMFVSLTRVCVVYLVEKVTSFPGRGQLMGVARKRTHARAHQKESCAAFVETRTNS